jgi:hypothetical protein
MNSKQQKAYDAQLDKMDLTDSQHTDNFSLHGYKLSKVMDDIVLAQYADLAKDGQTIERNGIYIPLAQVQKTWRLARVVLAGPNCKFSNVGDIVCFPDDKGIKVDNIKVAGYDDPLRNCLFLSEDRFFGVCEQVDQDDSRTE